MDVTLIEDDGGRVLAWVARRLQEKSTIAGIAGWLATAGWASFGGEVSSHADTITALAGMLSTALVTVSTKPRPPELLLAPAEAVRSLAPPPVSEAAAVLTDQPAPDAALIITPSVASAPAADPAETPPANSMENDMKLLVEIEEAAVSVLKAAGTEYKTFIITEGQKLVASAKQSYVGTLALNVVGTLENQAMDGTAKMATLISMVTPALAKLKADGGLEGLETSVEDFAIEFAQSVFNDFKADAAAVLAKAA